MELDAKGAYHSLVSTLGGLEALLIHITNGADWLVNVSQVKTESLPVDLKNSRKYNYSNWRGAFRNEYDAGSKTWDTYGPVWHGGQAIRGLVAASRVGQLVLDALEATNRDQLAGLTAEMWKSRIDAWMDGAELCAGFILDKQVRSSDKENGMILSYENSANAPQSSTMLEGMRGLWDLAAATGNATYAQAANAAVTWSVDNAWMRGHGLLYDLWDRQNQSFLHEGGWNYVTKDGAGDH